jgi:hypothetical protein
VVGQGYIVNIDLIQFFGNLGRRVYTRKAYDPNACMGWIERRTPWLDRKKKLEEMPPIWGDPRANAQSN